MTKKRVQINTNISTQFIPANFFARWSQHMYHYVLGVEDTSIEFVNPYINMSAGVINIARCQQIEQFLKDTDADWFFNVDCDQSWSRDGISRLVNTEADIVSAPVYLKRPPHTPNYFVYNKDSKELDTPIYMDNKPFYVDAVGFGFIAIKREVLEVLWNKYNSDLFYNPGKNDWNDAFLGEDVAFCYNAQKTGYKIAVNPNIDVKHFHYEEIGRQHYLKHLIDDSGKQK